MRNLKVVAILCLQLLLVGCAAMGVVESSDPQVKLNDAEYLYRNYDRPLPAEKLIFEAIEIYQKQGNSRGLGNAHRAYGDLLLSGSMAKWGKKMHYHDKSVTYDNRIAKSSEYFTKALEYYQASEKQPLEAKQFDNLTNLYFNMGWSYFRLNELKKSCSFYDKSLEAYAENIRRDPTAKPIAPSNFASYPDLVASEKKRASCE